jgi:hypothetical protein
MRNITLLFSLATLVVLGGCRVGEEDPGLSFKSRDKRIEGTWELTTGNMVIKSITTNQAPGSTGKSVTETTNSFKIIAPNAEYTYSQLVNGTKMGEDITQDIAFDILITVEEGGSYTNTFTGKAISAGGAFDDMESTSTGVWSWISNTKKKMGINFTNTSGAEGSEYINGEFFLKGLNDKEMILVREIRTVNTTTSSTAIQTIEDVVTMEFNFEKAE